MCVVFAHVLSFWLLWVWVSMRVYDLVLMESCSCLSLSSAFSPCVLSNLCLLSHGEAANLPSPLYYLRLLLFQLSSLSRAPPSTPLAESHRYFHGWLSLMRDEVSRRRTLSLASSSVLRSQDWRLGSRGPFLNHSGSFPACPPSVLRGRSPSPSSRFALASSRDSVPYEPTSPCSRSSSPSPPSTCFLSGHLVSFFSRSRSPVRREYRYSQCGSGPLHARSPSPSASSVSSARTQACSPSFPRSASPASSHSSRFEGMVADILAD